MKTVIINGHHFNLEKNLQDFVKFTMQKLLASNSISQEELKNLQDKDYCKSTFNLKYPLLSKDSNAYKKDEQHPRYYAKETFFSNDLYLCNDWYPKNEKPFSKWIRKIAKQ
ncbi:MAG: hypothetical protein IKK38_12235 [Spirochaetaceae bacterium]|nr:hypothetical protein [Spirochaetaceae bacterium]